MKIIAIDPGINGSGVAVLEDGKLTELHTFKTWELFGWLLDKDCVVVVENSNLDKRNWHGSTARENVGKNKSISQEIVDYCKAMGLNLVEVKPDGYSQVYPNKRYFEADTGWRGQSNKDTRAATAIAIRYYRTYGKI